MALGIEKLGGTSGAGWQVLTFDEDIGKRKAVRIGNQFCQYLSRYFRRMFGFNPEWVKTWETHRNGKLHLNLLMCPWRFVPQKLLATKWHKLGGGIVTWVERVGAGIGVEVAKARTGIGAYLGKLDQMVRYGRGICYSKGWPKLPSEPKPPRIGEIDWSFIGNFSQEGIEHWYDTGLGYWQEINAGEYKSIVPESCDCFEFGLNRVKMAKRRILRLREKYSLGKAVSMKPSQKSPEVEDIIRRSNPAGRDRRESISANICVWCGVPISVAGFRDELSRREYTISGFCQECQDDAFGVGEISILKRSKGVSVGFSSLLARNDEAAKSHLKGINYDEW